MSEIEFTISDSIDGPVFALTNATSSQNLLSCQTGDINDSAILTVNYPGILNVTETSSSNNSVTVPLTEIGGGGTIGFYPQLPVFFTASSENDAVFGGIIENRTYYVNTVLDNEHFTLSETEVPVTATVTETIASTDTVIVDQTEGFSVNDPIIFTDFVFEAGSFVIGQTYTIVSVGTTDFTLVGATSNLVGTVFVATGVGTGTGAASSTVFGTIDSSTIYYVCEIVSFNTLTITAAINSTAKSMNDQVGTGTMTSQTDVVSLTDAIGNMTLNVSLPVSPGQINGQQFTLYQTSGQYAGLGGTVGDVIVSPIVATISTVNRVALPYSTNMGFYYVNMPVQSDITIGGITAATTYYVIEHTGEVIPDPLNPGEYITRPAIEVQIQTTSSVENLLICDTGYDTSSLFVGMPIVFSGLGLGGINISQEYYVSSIKNSTQFTITDQINSTTSASQVSSVTFRVTVSNPDIFKVDDGVMFRGTIPGGVLNTTTTYFVESVGANYITVSTSLGGSPIDPGTGSGSFIAAKVVVLTTSNGVMLGTGCPYVVLSTSIGGSELALTTDTTGAAILTQYPDPSGSNPPVFDVSSVLGGYNVIITNTSSGFAINNTLTISGALVGGTSPANDIILIVNQISTLGEILDVIVQGDVPVQSNNYYLQVRSSNTLAVYSDSLMSVPVSIEDFPYVGYTQTTVTAITSTGNIITVGDSSGFDIYDQVVFTGDVLGNLMLGKAYYIQDLPSATEIVVSETPGGTAFDPGTASGAFTVAKAGSFAFLPEPFYFNQSIVRFNNRLYVCVVSNNDNDFVLGKWELISSDDPRLNALDRAFGYYSPTANMPGRDLTQLFEGITYPNPVVKGNAFQPSLQYPLDTTVTDAPFYPTGVNIQSVIYNGTVYLGVANLSGYSALVMSLDGVTWGIGKLTDFNINTTDVNYINNTYLVTSTNPVTPIFRSLNGTSWSTSGYFIEFAEVSEYGEPIVTSPLATAGLQLNSIEFYNNTYIAVGNGIFVSDDTYTWRAVTNFLPVYNYNLYDIQIATTSQFTGLVTVGSGLKYDYSAGYTQLVDTSVILYSTTGYNWTEIEPITSEKLYGVGSNSTAIIAVGEDGYICSSPNASDWYGISKTLVQSFSSTNYIISVDAMGMQVNDAIRFTSSFSPSISTSTTYYIKTITGDGTLITISATPGGATKTLSSGTVAANTFMYQYDATDTSTDTLRDVAYGSSSWVTVGDNGTIKTSTDGINWVLRSSGTTEDLHSVAYNSTAGKFIVSGDNNIVLYSSDNGVTWTSNVIFEVAPPLYTVRGAEFPYGYGPEELVPGNITDNLSMIVNTRPGSSWPVEIYGHTGFNVVSAEVQPSEEFQTVYYFGDFAETPAQISLQVLDGSTLLGTTLYPTEYTIDWVNKTITLDNPLSYYPVTDILRIDVYEVGNGDQLVKASTDTDVIRLNSQTLFTEIYVNCAYSEDKFNGSGVIKTGSSSVTVRVTETFASTNRILCDSVEEFTINDNITFQGVPFGNLLEDTNYYVKSISAATNTITVSLSYDPVTGIAGPTVTLIDATGSMYANIETGNALPWTTPSIYRNGTQLVLGTTGLVTRTKASNNSITTSTTAGLIVDTPITFCECMFGTIIQPLTTYYISSIIDGNEFTISTTPGGSVLVLDDDTGGSMFITNDYAFGYQPDGISAKIMFPVSTYTNANDYIVYALLGETTPEQIGYSLPQVQYYTGDGINDEFTMDNFTGYSNPANAIVEIDGLRVPTTDYAISSISNSITFTSIPAAGAVISVMTYNDTRQQYLFTQSDATQTVAPIIDINNTIVSPLVVEVTDTTSGTNAITLGVDYTTSGFIPNQTVVFKGTGFGGILTNGTVYFVNTVISSSQFTIKDYNGTVVTLTTASGSMDAEVGGTPAVRVTTSIQNGFVDNDIVRIDDVVGSYQLNDQTFYVKVITPYIFDLYTQAYTSAQNGTNYPVIEVSSYVSGGYAWIAGSFFLSDAVATSTNASTNYITLDSVDGIVVDTPIYFNEPGQLTGAVLMGGLVQGTEYYVLDVITLSNEISVSETRYGDPFVLTNDSGSINAVQWDATNVDRLWVTLNGYRIPSSRLRLNPVNEVSILTEIEPGDEVVITHMIPTATPNETVYMNIVDKEGNAAVYNCNADYRTWLTAPIYELSDSISVFDVSKITTSLTQTSTVPSIDNGYYYVGLTADKRIISSVTVYNQTKGQIINSANYSQVLVDIAPQIKITAGSYIAPGDILTITIIEGNTIYINGEQIRYSSVDTTTNTLSGLERGCNGTAFQPVIEAYVEVVGLLTENKLRNVYYDQTWNSNTYNPIEGDPLQISTTVPALFLNSGVS